jgi:gamma-glutamylcyclotransferase (GGCT)/AIG2-like uncharacterized protein YtfP
MFPHMSHDPLPGDLYFAYGSNLDLLALTNWCLQAGFAEPAVDVLGPAWLPDRRLAFTRWSAGWQGGVADVVPAPGCVAPGLLLRVRDAETWQALDAKEGVPFAYERLRWTALGDRGQSWPIWTYVVSQPRPFVEPAPAYVDLLQAGRASWGLPCQDLQAAVTGQDAALRPSLFVYGTLRRGQRNAGLLGEVRSVPGAVPGQLWHVSSDPPYPYPAMTLDVDGPSDVVYGEVVQAPAHRWQELDDLEGFSGFAHESGHLYRRVLWPLAPQAKEDPPGLCFVYAMDRPPPGPRIKTGDWLLQRAA